MAKGTQAPGVSQTWVVTVGRDRYETEATGADEAIDKVIADKKLQRDRRNFVALPKATVQKQGG